MKYNISDNNISVCIDDKCAEIISLKKNNIEYLWQGDDNIWKRQAPNLFPFVGRLKNGVYRHNGKTYKMNIHGFVSDMVFNLVQKTDNSIRFAICDTDETRLIYPFSFKFEVEYTIEESSIVQKWIVTNTGSCTMYFSLGGHPGFLCSPFGDSFYDCSIKFFSDSNCVIDKIVSRSVNDAGLVIDALRTFTLENNILKITPEIFSHDALILENSGIHKVSILDKSFKEFACVKFDADMFGLWSPQEKNAPFLCVEPWHGRCDNYDFDGELKDKEWVNTLEKHKVFEKSFSMTLF